MNIFFFFKDTATTELYTLSLHDALPICVRLVERRGEAVERLLARLRRGEELRDHRIVGARHVVPRLDARVDADAIGEDRKSTRLNSSHANISYAAFCLKKK